MIGVAIYLAGVVVFAAIIRELLLRDWERKWGDRNVGTMFELLWPTLAAVLWPIGLPFVALAGVSMIVSRMFKAVAR